MTSSLLTRVLLLIVLQSGCATAHAQTSTSPSRGQLLYTTHCVSCHTSEVHWRDKRQAKDWDSLKYQVRRWQAIAELRWSEEDVVQVTRHLNDTIYRYPTPSGDSSIAESHR